jgi:hypothetical protein
MVNWFHQSRQHLSIVRHSARAYDSQQTNNSLTHVFTSHPSQEQTMNSYEITPEEIRNPEPSLVAWAHTTRPIRLPLPTLPLPRVDDVLYALAVAALALTAVIVGMLA